MDVLSMQQQGVIGKDSLHGPWHVEAVVVETCGKHGIVKYSVEYNELYADPCSFPKR